MTLEPRVTGRAWVWALVAVALVVGLCALWRAEDRQWSDGARIRTAGATPRRVLWLPPEPLANWSGLERDDYEPSLSPDGTRMIFVRGRAKGLADLFESTWSPAGWSAPVAVVALNTDADEVSPAWSPDGRALYFASDREGGAGGFDLWMSRREESGWAAPVLVPGGVNTVADETNPAPSPDGQCLVFASDRARPGESPAASMGWTATLRGRRDRHDFDLYRAPMGAAGVAGPVVPMAMLNTGADEGTPSFSPVGDFLYFASDRAGGAGGLDLYRARWAAGEPGVAEAVGPGVNSAGNELDPALSAEGFALTFSADRAREGVEASRYSLWRTVSREVFEVRPESAWSRASWRDIWPWLLLAALLALLAWLVSMLRRGEAGGRRIGLLARCLLVSLLVHAGLAALFVMWRVGTDLKHWLGQAGGVQVVLGDDAADAGGEDAGGLRELGGEPVQPEVALAKGGAPELTFNERPTEVTPPRTRDDAPLPVTMERADPAPQTRVDVTSTPPSVAAAPVPPLPAALSEAAMPGPALAGPGGSAGAPEVGVRPTGASSVPVSPAQSTDAAVPVQPLKSGPEAEPASGTVAGVAGTIAAAPTKPSASQAVEEREVGPPGVATVSKPEGGSPLGLGTTQAGAADVAVPSGRQPPNLPVGFASGSSSAGPNAQTSQATVAAGPASGTAARMPQRAAPARREEREASADLAGPSRGSGDAPGIALPSTAPAEVAIGHDGPGVAAPIVGVPARTDAGPSGVAGSVVAEPTAGGGLLARLPSASPAPEPVENFAQRAPEVRAEMLAKAGGSGESERAVGLALEWLARHQSPDGSWSAAKFDAGCGGCSGPGEIEAPAGMTGLALLTFLGAGHTQAAPGPYQGIVRRGLQWLLDRQGDDGDLRRGETMYGQTVATAAICEAYSMTRDPALAEAATRGVRYVLDARRRDRATAAGTAVVGWQVMAIESARRAGIEVKDDLFREVDAWLLTLTTPGRPGRYAYRVGEAPSAAMTAEAMFVRQLLGAKATDARMRDSAAFILETPPSWRQGAPTYYWYYATLAMFQQGGASWAAWRDGLTRELLAHQASEGPEMGSWEPQDRWSKMGGRVYQTSVCALSLEVYYRYRASGEAR